MTVNDAQPTDPRSFEVITRAVLRNGPRVLLARYVDHDFWFLPGGAVRVGESAVTALRRETMEELNLDARVGDLLAVTENQYELDGSTHHEINLVFDVRVDGRIDRSHREDVVLEWFLTDETLHLDIRPRSLANIVRYGPGRARLPLQSDGLPR